MQYGTTLAVIVRCPPLAFKIQYTTASGGGTGVRGVRGWLAADELHENIISVKFLISTISAENHMIVSGSSEVI